jgi:SNF2 family DNA or RNA helicase
VTLLHVCFRPFGKPQNPQMPPKCKLEYKTVQKHTLTSIRFRNKVTGIYSGSPTRLKGGLLADVCQITSGLACCMTEELIIYQDMGLGKTLSTLALICSSLDHHTGNEDASLPTLVVTTKSSKSSQS